MKNKKVVSVPFDEREELNAFLNQHHIKKEDIINIGYNWNLGYYIYTLTFYAAPDLFPVINRKIEQNKKEWQKAVLLTFAIVLFLIVCFFFLLRWWH